MPTSPLSMGNSVYTFFDSLSIAWSTSKASGIFDSIHEILRGERGDTLSTRRSEWGETYFWKQRSAVDLGDSHWLQIAPEDLSSDLAYFIVAVQEPDQETSVFVCSAFESVTHYTRSMLARHLKEKKNIDLTTKLVEVRRSDMINLSKAVDSRVRVVGFSVTAPDGLATISYPALASTTLQRVVSELEESQQIIAIILEIAGLRLKLRPRSLVGGEPILVAELLASREVLTEALGRLALIFDKLEKMPKSV